MPKKRSSLLPSSSRSVREPQLRTAQLPKSSTTISDLPCCVMSEIISRLPAKRVFACRCVCKAWLSSATGPGFAKLHMDRSPPDTVMLLSIEAPTQNLRLLDLDDPYLFRISKEFSFNPSFSYSDLLSSCNGLFLFYDSVSLNLYVYNPIVGKHVVLDKSETAEDEIVRVCGIGYSAVSGKFKVMKVVSNKSSGATEVHLFVLGRKDWRNIGRVPFTIGAKWSPRDVSIHGAIHVSVWDQSPRSMFSFEIETEQFRVSETCRECCEHRVTKDNCQTWINNIVDKRWGWGSICLTTFSNGEDLLLDEEGKKTLYSSDRLTHQRKFLRKSNTRFVAKSYVPSFVSPQDL